MDLNGGVEMARFGEFYFHVLSGRWVGLPRGMLDLKRKHPGEEDGEKRMEFILDGLNKKEWFQLETKD